jgi:hypothetical protein
VAYQRRDVVTPDVILHFSKGRQVFEFMVAAAEVAISGEAILQTLDGRASRVDDYAVSLDTRRSLSAFTAARRRLEHHRRLVDARFMKGTEAFDTSIARELNRTATVGRARSMDDILVEAELVQRRVDDFVAQAPGSGGDDTTLPPDGGTDGGTNSGGGGSPAPPPPDPLDQYSDSVLQDARSEYEPRIGEPAATHIQTTTVEIIEIFDSTSDDLPELQRQVDAATERFNAGLTAIVVGACTAIGGLVGAALAAIALLVLQDAFGSIGELIRGKWARLTEEA